jgi:hypothetical protein
MRIVAVGLLVAMLGACEGVDDTGTPVIGGGKGDGIGLELIPLADREAFCNLASPSTPEDEWAWDVCVNYAALSATQHIWHEACRSDKQLRLAMACVGSSQQQQGDCQALYDTWRNLTESKVCDLPVGWIGIGDPYPEHGDGPFFCASGSGEDAGACTRSCWEDADCAGAGQDGRSRFGYRNVCVKQECVATCSTTTDCSDRFNSRRIGNDITCDLVTTEEGGEAKACRMHKKDRD